MKTRLIPALGVEGAAHLYRTMAQHCIMTAATALPGRVELWCAPDTTHSFFREAQTKWGVALRVQSAGDIDGDIDIDIGSRMSTAARTVLDNSDVDAVLIIGTDAPSLTVADIDSALAALSNGRDAVFSPAEDGGYALIGLTRHDARLFDGIAWSTSEVMAQTRERLRALAWDWLELPVRWDVDTPDDLARLAADASLAYLVKQARLEATAPEVLNPGV